MEQRCPVCRSLFELDGSIDFAAPALQEVVCPVCGAKIWVAAGFPLPRRWRVGKILEQSKDAIKWEDIVKQAPGLEQDIPKEYQQSAYSDFFKPQVDFFKNLGQGAYKIAIWAVVVLVLIFLIKRKEK